MAKVTLVGEYVEPGILKVFDNRLPIVDISKSVLGKRIEVEGYLKYKEESGSFIKTTKYHVTDSQDKNSCIVSGSVVGVLEEKPHPTHGRSACIIIKQSDARDSKVLVTVTGPKIDEVGVDNLSIGQNLTIKGFVTYHSKGLHVTYCRKEEQ